MAELRSGGWTRWTSLRSDHRVHPPTLRIRHPPLSFSRSVHPPSLGQKAVSGTATQSRALFVRCRLTPSAFRPTGHSLLNRGCCSVGDACRSLRSLCRFPPPSPLPLPRYARAPPPRGIYMSCGYCAHRRSGKPAALPTHRCAQKAVGSVFVRCRQSRPLGATGTLNYKYEGGDPQPLPSYL